MGNRKSKSAVNGKPIKYILQCGQVDLHLVPLIPLRKDVECTLELSLCGRGSYDINL